MTQQADKRMVFCEVTGNLLVETIENGQLGYKSPEGRMYVPGPEHTVLRSDDFTAVKEHSRFANLLQATAYDPVNPRIAKPCPDCGAAIVSYQRIGEAKLIVYMCDCGTMF